MTATAANINHQETANKTTLAAVDREQSLDEKIHQLEQRGKQEQPNQQTEKPDSAPDTDDATEQREYSIQEAATEIQNTIADAKIYGRKTLFLLLRENNIAHGNGALKNLPKNQYLNNERQKDREFCIKAITKKIGGQTQTFQTTYATTRGLILIAELVEKDIADKKAKKEAEKIAAKLEKEKIKPTEKNEEAP